MINLGHKFITVRNKFWKLEFRNKYSPFSSKEKNANKLYEYVFAPDGFLKGILGHPVFHTKSYALEKLKGYFSFYTYKYFLQGKVLLEYSQKIVFSFP